ncbi:MAG: 2-amino-4-hydroxy-6-hydroxymethyldihydropteridine diphosphokinase [Chloroflexota bacterium]
MAPVIAYLSLGSNLGQREANLRVAISSLSGGRGNFHATGAGAAEYFHPQDAEGRRAPPATIEVLRASSVYETAPWGYTGQPDFLNCVLEVRTSLSPRQLLALVKGVEQEMGRQPGVRYGPRLIDVDILLYGDKTVDLPDLKIPHPGLPQRAFVLVPLAELAPWLVHPTLGVPISELARRVEGLEGVMPWGSP